MGKISVNINDSLEEKLRKLIETKYRGKRGAMSIIVEDALEEYLRGLEQR